MLSGQTAVCERNDNVVTSIKIETAKILKLGYIWTNKEGTEGIQKNGNDNKIKEAQGIPKVNLEK